MRENASAWRLLQVVAGGIVAAGNTLLLALVICFRDEGIRSGAAAGLLAGTLIGIPLVIRPMWQWLRDPADYPLPRGLAAQWFSGLALISAQGGKRRTEKAAYLLCENGIVQAAACRFNEAEWKLREAAEIFEELEDKPNQAVAWFELGNCRLGSGETEGAIVAYRRALDIWEQIADHQRGGHTWRLFNNLSAAYSEAGDLDAAAQFCGRAMNAAPDAKSRATCMLNLADILRRHGQYREALRTIEDALGRLDPGRDEAYAFGLLTVAMVHDDQDHAREAGEFYRQAQRLLERQLWPGHIEVARVLERHGELLERSGREREGAALIARAAGIRDTLG